jgi:hypothetical protein
MNETLRFIINYLKFHMDPPEVVVEMAIGSGSLTVDCSQQSTPQDHIHVVGDVPKR